MSAGPFKSPVPAKWWQGGFPRQLRLPACRVLLFSQDLTIGPARPIVAQDTPC